jgi:hypothetical protein
MKNRPLKTWLILITLALFGLNFTPVLAQVLEVEVIGGGYRLVGPETISFPKVMASLEAQSSIQDIRDLNEQDEQNPQSTTASDYILIEDRNGGNAFNVTVKADDFTDQQTGQTISNSNFFIKNKNGKGQDISANNSATSLSGVALHTDTNSFASLNIERTLFTGDGAKPGSWRIYPVFKINVPANTVPGTYRSTLTFTII